MIFKRQLGNHKHHTFSACPIRKKENNALPIGLRRRMSKEMRFRCIRTVGVSFFETDERTLGVVTCASSYPTSYPTNEQFSIATACNKIRYDDTWLFPRRIEQFVRYADFYSSLAMKLWRVRNASEEER